MRHRLHSICPYFAMFPASFVAEWVRALTQPGDWVFDPFSGRGTTLLQSLLMGRRAAATDVNPVGYCISAAKGDVPSLEALTLRIQEIEHSLAEITCEERGLLRRNLPAFFRRCFYWSTLDEILHCRQSLQWATNSTDRFLAALMLGSLHGDRDKSPSYFSNQMPRTISTKPEYSLNYWKKHNLWPRRRQVFDLLRGRAHYRLDHGRPAMCGRVALRDARHAHREFPELSGKVKLVVTSPPYLDVTNYEEDQWLRLWFLGHDPHPTRGKHSRDDRHVHQGQYWEFLAQAWRGMSPLVAAGATVVCRLGAKGLSIEALTRGLFSSLEGAFPGVRRLGDPRVSWIARRQTDYFRPGSDGCRFEVDYVFAV